MIYTVTFNPSLDYYVKVNNLKSGIVNRTSTEYITVGGKGLNVSLALKELGNESIAYGFIAGFTGKAIDEIDLQAENPKQEIQAVKLYVDKRNAQPLYIKITDCNKNINEIEVTSLKKALLLPDNRFIFDTKQYPNVEVIDLR